MTQWKSVKRFAPALVFLACSCSLFSTSAKFGSVDFSVEEMQNGYLVEIQAEHPMQDVTTLVTPANWLTITVTDTLLDTTLVAAYRSPMVDSTLVRRFETATQFSLRFTKPVSSAEVLHEHHQRNILISVFFR
jgi:hypothetical protein